MNYRFLVRLVCLLWLLNACGVSTASLAPSTTQCYVSSEIPTTTPVPPIPTRSLAFPASQQQNGNMWQPPVPVYSSYEYPPFSALPPLAVQYTQVGLGGGPPNVAVTYDGVVYALTSDGEQIGRLHLSQNALDDLLAQIKAIEPSTLQGDYIEADTNGVRELDYRTINVATADHAFTVTMRGNPGIPNSLLNLESTLIDLAKRAHACVPPAPQIVIEYWLYDRVHYYGLQIDSTGGVYFGSHYAGQIAQENFETLVTFFKSPTFQDQKGSFVFKGTRDTKSEQRVIVSYMNKQVNAFSGATIPPEMQIVLQLLADIHTQFYPTH